jgi:type VI secretion system secreted protein VgrG
MPNSPTQDHRAGVLTTPLGKDALVLVRFDCEEAISELFEFRVEALSEKPDIDFEGAIGGDCSITYETFDGEKREFNGVLAEAQWVGVENHLFSYQLVLRPWLWLLSHRTDCRIFRGDEGDTVPKIIEAVFEKAGLLRAVSRNRFQFCVSAHGERRHLLFL